MTNHAKSRSNKNLKHEFYKVKTDIRFTKENKKDSSLS